jgi:hypothetical protein
MPELPGKRLLIMFYLLLQSSVWKTNDSVILCGILELTNRKQDKCTTDATSYLSV